MQWKALVRQEKYLSKRSINLLHTGHTKHKFITQLCLHPSWLCTQLYAAEWWILREEYEKLHPEGKYNVLKSWLGGFSTEVPAMPERDILTAIDNDQVLLKSRLYAKIIVPR